MYKKVAFTVYPVSDVARARDFYEKTVGLVPGLTGTYGEVSWIEYDLPGGGCFAISNAGPTTPSDRSGGTVAFEVDDLDESMADLRAKGVAFGSDVIKGPACRMIVCLDSEGNSFMLHQHDSSPSGAESTG